ncbi:MAG: TonB C-terminal domain-containing protein [Polyangiaceae bacterium]
MKAPRAGYGASWVVGAALSLSACTPSPRDASPRADVATATATAVATATSSASATPSGKQAIVAEAWDEPDAEVSASTSAPPYLGPEPTIDPEGAALLTQYRARLIAFFRRDLNLKGLGLAPEDKKKLKAPVTVSLDATGKVLSVVVAPSGNTSFDQAVRDSMVKKVGSSIPPAPEGYEDMVGSTLSFIITCGEGCD